MRPALYRAYPVFPVYSVWVQYFLKKIKVLLRYVAKKPFKFCLRNKYIKTIKYAIFRRVDPVVKIDDAFHALNLEDLASSISTTGLTL